MAKTGPDWTLDTRLVFQTALAGAVLQLALAGAAHAYPWVAIHLVLFGRAMASATAGYLYGLIRGRGFGAGALGGAIAGGLCVVPALALSLSLADHETIVATTSAGISVLTGAVGGAFGQLGAILRRLGL
jgi:hypothetical protein